MHKLPELSYTYDALELFVDAQTMEIHHARHHQTYVDNLNKALEGQDDLLSKSVENLICDLSSVSEDIRVLVRNNGGGHVNHSFFWRIMSPDGGGSPGEDLRVAINDIFGGFDKFKEEFLKVAMARFGSGWVWLVMKDNKLSIISTPNQDNPIMEGGVPILGLDVWEHAYYLKYQNKRMDYINNWWNVVNWKEIESIFKEIKN